MTSPLKPSSSTEGFFQEKPRLYNQVQDDVAFQRAASFYLPTAIHDARLQDISRFADICLTKQVFTWIADSERNTPYVQTWDAFGKRHDQLVTSEGWRQLQNLGIKEGMVAIPFENADGEYSRVYQFLKYLIWTPSCAYVTCPSGMADGAARLISRHLANPSLASNFRLVLQSAYDRLISRTPEIAWTSGQWMTERPGGSDVSRTETLAVFQPKLSAAKSVDGFPLGDYSIKGFKWFSSATDSQMTILIARLPDGKLSAFFAPMRRSIGNSEETELNGIKIQRLKNKFGTKAVPTAELELDDMRAYLVGKPGDGIREIATMLNITRLHTALTSIGLWGRGLAIARGFTNVRVVGKKSLRDIPAHIAQLARMETTYRGWMHVAYLSVLFLGVSEQHTDSASTSSRHQTLDRVYPASTSDANHLLRILTPMIKAMAGKYSSAGLAECMECLGGVGYLENEDMEVNIARLYRDCLVTCIWEGTTAVMAHDVIRVVKGKTAKEVLAALSKWVKHANVGHGLEGRMDNWTSRARRESAEELALNGRDVMEELGNIIGGVLLLVDTDRDGDKVTAEISRRWLAICDPSYRKAQTFNDKVAWDHKIVLSGRSTSLQSTSKL